MDILENYYGRQLLPNQLPDNLVEKASAVEATGIKAGSPYCCRCHTQLKQEWSLPDGSRYCRECIAFGRIVTGDILYRFEQKPFEKRHYLNWTGQLTQQQAAISKELVTRVNHQQDVLVQAVTGAGKTEMIYQLVDDQLSQGKALAIVSPRIDVCRELFSRFKRDFTCRISLLHTGSEPYKRSPLLISTTHQLFKFYQAFDLIIVDEVDAFPFVDNQALYQAVKGALKAQGTKVYLTATSTDKLDQMVKKQELMALNLPKRFHNHPLVIPKLRWLGGLEKALAKDHLPKKLLKAITEQQKTGYPLLIFYPTIKEGAKLTTLLQKQLPGLAIGFVSSENQNRKEIVEKFRKGDLTLLITTTILERGVTFPKVDVFILESQHRLYTKSALVQISGRVGRSADRPEGRLVFYHTSKTKQMTRAIKEIKQMNKLGGF